MRPTVLNTLTLAAEDAGTHRTCRATVYSFGRTDLLSSHNWIRSVSLLTLRFMYSARSFRSLAKLLPTLVQDCISMEIFSPLPRLNSHLVHIPIPFPFPFPWLILLPFPWESHGTHGIPDPWDRMHISTLDHGAHTRYRVKATIKSSRTPRQSQDIKTPLTWHRKQRFYVLWLPSTTNRSFRCSAPCLWNELPADLRELRQIQSPSLSPITHGSSPPSSSSSSSSHYLCIFSYSFSLSLWI